MAAPFPLAEIHQPARPGGGRRLLPASSAVGVYWCFLLFAFSSSWLFLRFVFASFGSFIELRSSFVFIISHASLSLCSWNCRRFPGPANGCSRPSSAHGRLVSRFMLQEKMLGFGRFCEYVAVPFPDIFGHVRGVYAGIAGHGSNAAGGQ